MLLQTTKQKRLLLNAFAFLFRVFGAVGEEKKISNRQTTDKRCAPFNKDPPLRKREREG
tara:strand:+ start:1513 stop:1689 length:177 start_codon:yes stop_codon:yes gene_type:complete